MPFIGKSHNKQPPNPSEKRAEEQSQWIAEVYVNRRKVGEERGATREEASQKAKTREEQYPDARVSTILRKAPRSKKNAG